jgi:LL-diaminopimelate aminotransferase
MAVAALTGDQSWIIERNRVYRERRDLCLATLARLGLSAEKPQAALYVWFRAPAGVTSQDFHTRLLEEAHLSVTPGHIYGHNGAGWMRISLAVKTERLKEALGRLERVLVND